MPHLLSISLGPVQDFIASARRTRDFWFGSYLLSELSKAAARGLVDSGQCAVDGLVFPAPASRQELDRDSELNVANKILAVVQDPEASAQAARTEVERILDEMFQEATREFMGRPGFDQESAEKQIRDLVEFYWASVPETGLWKQDRARVEALLAARKNLRNFAPVGWGSHRPKASLDGQRETVLDLPEFLKALPDEASRQRFLRRHRMRESELLCAVSMLKRFGARGHEEAQFLSTAHVAALSALERVGSSARPALKAFRETLAGLGLEDDQWTRIPREFEHPFLGNLDAQFLFEGRLESLFEGNPQQARQASKALSALRREIGISRPTPYYAILLADGDRMGVAIDAQSSEEGHRALSRELAKFAGRARQVVREHSGALVYAGGDDVLALLPVTQALDCARTLAEGFAELMKGFGQEGQRPTLSVGVAIVHHSNPLGDALDLARRMEKLAKRERNSLAVGVDKRSGSEVSAVGTWGTLDVRLPDWIRLLQQEALPRGAAYELRQMVVALGEAHKPPPGLLEAEARRILLRKRPERGKKKIEEQSVSGLLQDLSAAGTEAEAILTRAREILVAGLFRDALGSSGRLVTAAANKVGEVKS